MIDRAEIEATMYGRTAGAPLQLTPREREVARMRAAGCSRREMAERLGLSEATVRNHLTRAWAKTRGAVPAAPVRAEVGDMQDRTVEMALERHGFTPKEREIARVLIRTGAHSDELARACYIQPMTLKNHLTSMYGKTRTTNRTQLALKLVGALEDGDDG